MCILLVEDDPFIRELTAEYLQEAGYEVTEARSGDQALELFRPQPDRFCLLITDFNMPGQTNGSQAAAHMRLIRPSLPVVIASGQPETFQPDWQHKHGYVLLRKPYRPAELVGLARNLIQSG